MNKVALAVLLAASVSGCAMGTTKVALAPPVAKMGVMSEAASAKVDVPAVIDARAKTDRIGDKRNGYGMVMGAIAPEEAPTITIEKALEQVITANKHTLGGEGDRYALQSTLKTFWLDYKTGLVTVEFFGTVQADVALVDRTTGQKLYTETVDGYYSEKTGGGLSNTWTRIMNAAVADFITKVSNSEGLKNALSATAAPAAAVAPAEAPTPAGN